MHTEHLSNLHPGWVLGGWLVAVAVASIVFMVLVGTGLVAPDAGLNPAMVLAAVAAGFFAGGLFVGLRWSDAPILHGAAITFLSVVVWLAGNLLLPANVGGADPRIERPAFVLGVIVLQLVSSVAGGWLGRRMVRRGETPTFEG